MKRMMLIADQVTFRTTDDNMKEVFATANLSSFVPKPPTTVLG